MDDRAVARAAEVLFRARVDGGIVEALPDGCRPRDEEEAYTIQAALHNQMTAAGHGPLDGYKIGCTTPVMQAFLKISQPCAGGVLAPTVRLGTGRFHAPARGRLGVECEVAVRLRTALDPSDSPFQRDHIADAVGSCMASIEIVADRYDDYGSLGTPTLIADDFFNAGIVLGDPVEDWRDLDLAALRGQMSVNGEVVGSGVGGDILGHPLEALVWLANRWSGLGRGLPAGAFVTLGSVVETKWVNASDDVVAEIEGLGEVRAVFE
ncbi:MAG: fumarylacetoacetate hydrolase family protein [bacterium]|nr:fumarylacetoacetate hydrolase family protein [bacterium]